MLLLESILLRLPEFPPAEFFKYNATGACFWATPHCRILTPPILTRHLYHHTPLVEYILKHLYMYPALFSLGHGTSLIHIIVHMHTSICICTLMDTHVYICMQMYVHYPILG